MQIGHYVPNGQTMIWSWNLNHAFLHPFSLDLVAGKYCCIVSAISGVGFCINTSVFFFSSSSSTTSSSVSLHLSVCLCLGLGLYFPFVLRLEPDILLRAKQDFLKIDSDADLQWVPGINSLCPWLRGGCGSTLWAGSSSYPQVGRSKVSDTLAKFCPLAIVLPLGLQSTN